jgi:polyphenol oxidase
MHPGALPEVFVRLEDGSYAAEPLLAFDWLRHSFGTRTSSGLAGHMPYACLHQIHSDCVQVVDAGQVGYCGEGDALVTAAPGHLVGVRTADCLPLLLADTRQRVVAMVHAGWRGVVAGIAAKTAIVMHREFGSRVEDLHAALGPAIAACCFEVGPEVAVRFKPWFPERQDLDSRTRVDLAAASVRQLTQLGLPSRQIYAGSLCTFCRDQEFFSYRRDATGARMISVAGIAPG